MAMEKITPNEVEQFQMFILGESNLEKKYVKRAKRIKSEIGSLQPMSKQNQIPSQDSKQHISKIASVGQSANVCQTKTKKSIKTKVQLEHKIEPTKVPQTFVEFVKIPQTIDDFDKIHQTIDEFRKIPETIDDFDKLPRTIDDFIKLPLNIDDFEHVFPTPLNHLQTGPTKCQMCDTTVKNKKCLIRHIKRIHKDLDASGPIDTKPSSIDPHTCTICNNILSCKRNLQLHMYSFHGENNLVSKFKCPICSQNYFSQGLLNTHVKRAHECKDQKICHLCNKLFSKPYTLKKHVQTVHEKIRPFQCPQCPKSFGLKWIQEQHTTTVHLKLEKFECSICQKTFTQRNSKNYKLMS